MEEYKEAETLEGNYKDSTGQVMGTYDGQIQNEYTYGLQHGHIEHQQYFHNQQNGMAQPEQPQKVDNVDLMGGNDLLDFYNQPEPTQQQPPIAHFGDPIAQTQNNIMAPTQNEGSIWNLSKNLVIPNGEV